MPITFNGISSGLDTTSIVNALVSAESAPLTAMQTKQQNVDSATTTLQSFASTLTAFRSAAATLADPAQFASYVATSSGPAIVPSATGTLPVAGSYGIQVNALAQEQRTYSDPQSSSTSALGLSGTLGLTIGATTTSINITAGESLTDIASAIGSSGAQVSANVLFDGTNYRLQVRGLNSGASNAIGFSETGFSLGLTNSANTPQKAQDASVSLDGITYTRSTNAVVGVIPGVSLALTQTTTSPVTIQVASDPTGLEAKVQAFVTAYNNVVTAGHTDAGYASTAASNAVLQSNMGIRSALDQMSGLIDAPITGATGTYTSLGDVGIAVQNNGTLTFDTTKFEGALSNDSTSVTSLFTTTTANPSAGIMSAFESFADRMTGTPGATIDGEVGALQTQSTGLQNEEQTLQTQISQYQTRIQTQFSNLETQINKYKTLDSTILNAAFPGLGGSSSSSNNSSNAGLSFGTVKTTG